MEQYHRPPVKEIEREFFKFMRCGYATDATKLRAFELPGAKIIPYDNGPYTGSDCYFVGAHGYTSGITTLCYEGQPVWSMSYYGQYQKEAIPYLKQALMRTYENDDFVGCRGPVQCDGDGWRYENASAGNFGRFEGVETILLHGSSLRGGWHKYSGILLF